MQLAKIVIRESFLPAFALLVAMTLGELAEPGFSSGAVHLPLFTVAVIVLGAVRVYLDS